MGMMYREMVIKKISEMSKEQVTKVLIFMAGMEAEHSILCNKSDTMHEVLFKEIESSEIK